MSELNPFGSLVASIIGGVIGGLIVLKVTEIDLQKNLERWLPASMNPYVDVAEWQ